MKSQQRDAIANAIAKKLNARFENQPVENANAATLIARAIEAMLPAVGYYEEASASELRAVLEAIVLIVPIGDDVLPLAAQPKTTDRLAGVLDR
jgi:hypothetical protein